MTKTNAQAATKTRAAKAKPVAAPKVNADAITESKAANQNDSTVHLIVSAGGETYTFPTVLWTGEIRTLTAIGASFAKAVAAIKALPKPRAQMARGIKQGEAPQSAKALADAARVAKGAPKASNKADGATQKPASGKKAPKAEKAAPVKSKYSGTYKWTGENKAREGTWRHAMLDCAAKNTTTEAGDACLKKNREFGSQKMDWRWMAGQGYIKFA